MFCQCKLVDSFRLVFIFIGGMNDECWTMVNAREKGVTTCT